MKVNKATIKVKKKISGGVSERGEKYLSWKIKT